jgi:hypothetical protein
MHIVVVVLMRSGVEGKHSRCATDVIFGFAGLCMAQDVPYNYKSLVLCCSSLCSIEYQNSGPGIVRSHTTGARV